LEFGRQKPGAADTPTQNPQGSRSFSLSSHSIIHAKDYGKKYFNLKFRHNILRNKLHFNRLTVFTIIFSEIFD
jgi:hypothetical protein